MKDIYPFNVLARYYGMTITEFSKLINGNPEKLARFIHDFEYNNNKKFVVR